MKAVMRDKHEMKDSGIDWIGEIPKNWNYVSLKRIYDYADDGAVKVGPFGSSLPSNSYVNDGIWVYNQRTVLDNNFETNDTFVDEIKAQELNSFKVVPNDILITTRGTVGKIAIVPQYAPKGILHPCIIRFRIDKRLYVVELLKYMFNESDFMLSQIMRRSNSTTLDVIYSYSLKELKLPLMSLVEQKVIANYLDDRCSKIDAIIAEAKASIEEYKELKQAVIYEAVTKGLDKNAKMKDSSIEWLGSIPAQWNLVKTNRIIDNTQNGLTRRDLDKSDGQIVLKLKNINAEGEIDYSDTNRIQLTNDEIEKYRLHNGDLLFVRVNGSRDLVGKCAIFEEKDEAIAYNDHIIRVTLNDYCIPEYVKWYLLCDSGKSEIALKINTAAGQFTISGEGLRAIYMPLPSLNEQREIVEFLNNKTKKIDFIINEKQSLIEDLDAYKKSLIYEVVTGKRKVVA